MSDDDIDSDDKSIPRMSDDALRNFVIDVADGRVLTSHQVTPEDLGRVFMPLALGAIEGWSHEEIAQIGTIWERIDKAGPLSINGYPMFFSCHLMHRDDWKRVRPAIVAELERRKNLKV